MASDGATANRQIPDRILVNFLPVWRRVYRFGRGFHRLLENQMYFATH